MIHSNYSADSTEKVAQIILQHFNPDQGGQQRLNPYHIVAQLAREGWLVDKAKGEGSSNPWDLLTDRQTSAMTQVLADLSHYWNIRARPDLLLQEETRAGRGHDLRWWCYDNDMLTTGTMDVYGYGSYGVGEVDWDHSEGEECHCYMCQRERENDE